MVVAVVIVFVLLGVVAVYYGVPVVYVWLARWQLRRQAREGDFMVVTFDDGPGETLTPQVLSVLREYDCRASFFVLGRSARGREDIVRRLREEGHDVYSHGYDHVDHWKVLPFRAIADIRAGWKALDAALGSSRGTYPFRPPYGRLNLASLLYLWWKGVSIHFWTTDSLDTRSGASQPQASLSADAAARQGAGVLLYHDFERRSPAVRQYVLLSLQATIQVARQAGLECVPISQLAESSQRCAPLSG